MDKPLCGCGKPVAPGTKVSIRADVHRDNYHEAKTPTCYECALVIKEKLVNILSVRQFLMGGESREAPREVNNLKMQLENALADAAHWKAVADNWAKQYPLGKPSPPQVDEKRGAPDPLGEKISAILSDLGPDAWLRKGARQEAVNRILALVAPSPTAPASPELERYRQALESIAANSCCEGCQEAKRVAQTALGSRPSEGGATAREGAADASH